MSNKLIIAADGFGLTPRINEAIAIACRAGILASTGLMVTGGGFGAALDIVRREPKLDMGLHLDLGKGRASSNPSKIPTLADSNGFLYKHPLKLAAALFKGRITTDDLEREIRAQIEKVAGSALSLTHVDGHKHVHVMPTVFRMICRVAPCY